MDFLAPIDESDDIDLDVTVEQECESLHLPLDLEPNKGKKRKLTSYVWKFFTHVEGVDSGGRQRAKCNACGTTYAVGGSKYGTHSMQRHLDKCNKTKYEDVGQMMVDMQGKLKSRHIDNLISREKCAKLIIKRDLPFKFAEYDELTDWLQYLNPEYTPITRNTARADVVKIYMREKAKIKEELAKTPCRISLTSDLWTSINTEGYITLTAHYVDTNWKLNSKILNFCHMPPPHTGFELSKKTFEFLTAWGIEKKVFSITLDNASANDVMQQTLKSQLALQKWLLCEGEFFHIRCSAHILNLIVQEGLKVALNALHNIRESIKHVKGSESRMIKFKQCIDTVGNIDISSGLVTDVPTRWNSTYLMLKSALKYRLAFENLHCYDANYRICEIRVGRQQSVSAKVGQSQLDMYLEERMLDLDYTEDLDVLQWWKNTRQRYPELSIMARDLLSIPITTVASESSFSIGSRVLNKYRNRLLSENVEALLCARNWLHAFDDDGNDDDNDDEKDGPTCSKSASNIIDIED